MDPHIVQAKATEYGILLTLNEYNPNVMHQLTDSISLTVEKYVRHVLLEATIQGTEFPRDDRESKNMLGKIRADVRQIESDYTLLLGVTVERAFLADLWFKYCENADRGLYFFDLKKLKNLVPDLEARLQRALDPEGWNVFILRHYPTHKAMQEGRAQDQKKFLIPGLPMLGPKPKDQQPPMPPLKQPERPVQPKNGAKVAGRPSAEEVQGAAEEQKADHGKPRGVSGQPNQPLKGAPKAPAFNIFQAEMESAAMRALSKQKLVPAQPQDRAKPPRELEPILMKRLKAEPSDHEEAGI